MAKAKTIAVPFESWFYLQTESHNQRSESGKPLDKERFKRMFDNHVKALGRNGTKLLKPGDLGGCIGDPHHAYEEGRWTSWTLEQMKAMLDAAGLPWEDGEVVEYHTMPI